MALTLTTINSLETAKDFMLYLLKQAIDNKADDIFIITDFSPAFKISGKLQPMLNNKLDAKQTKLLVYSLMNAQQIEEFEINKDCNFAISHPDGDRFRVCIYLEQNKPAMVLRKINIIVPTLKSISAPPILSQIAMAQSGLVLVVGPTGSGKSTTLAAMLDYRNANTCEHILSIEDPIEFVHTHKNCIISQREVGTDVADWHSGIKAALRQSPNVMLIGEIRDADSMEYALQFSETGHLCMATVHATNTIQAIDRIINLFPLEKRDQILINLSLNLKAIIGQRLITLINNAGRTPALEILLNTSTIADYIFRQQLDEIKPVLEKSSDLGMQTFDQSIFKLYNDKKISYEEAIKNADSINDMKLKIKLEGQENLSDNFPTLKDLPISTKLTLI